MHMSNVEMTFNKFSSLFTSLGMGMLADRYHDDNERGAAVGFALSGLAFGVFSKDSLSLLVVTIIAHVIRSYRQTS